MGYTYPEMLTGPVRPDRRAGRLLGRLRPGDIALIDQADLDTDTAAALVRAQVRAVLNARPSLSGRLPAPGPGLLVRHGVPLIDEVGQDLFGLVRDGDRVTIDGETVVLGRLVVGLGVRQDEARLAAAMSMVEAGVTRRLERLAADPAQWSPTVIPDVRTDMVGRHCVVVTSGRDTATELSALSTYLAECAPVLIGVGAGGDALLDAGYRPDLILADAAAVSGRARHCGAELVVSSAPVPSAPVPSASFPAPAPAPVPAADLALLVAERAGAALIVTIGARGSFADLLDGARGGSTLLTRLRLGGRVVDAARVAALRPAVATGSPVGLLAAGVGATLATLLVTTVGHGLLDHLANAWISLL